MQLLSGNSLKPLANTDLSMFTRGFLKNYHSFITLTIIFYFHQYTDF